MEHNERVMQERMMTLEREKADLELRINFAAITIQKHVRMRIQRKKYLVMKAENDMDLGDKLEAMLKDMQATTNELNKVSQVSLDESAIKIQRATRLMLDKIRFRTCLYKLILIRNIIENKVHKEKMGLLFSFEQLIINTEEAQEEEELRAQEEEQYKIREEIMRITGTQNPSTSSYILQ